MVSEPASLDVSVLIPAHNEAGSIVGVLHSVRDALRQWPRTSEVIVVDDGSEDATAEVARGLATRVICQPVRRGYGAAIKLGVAQATGRFLAVLDADGSYQAQDLIRLLQHIPDYDMVSGVRDRERGTWTPLRIMAKWVLRWIVQWGLGQRVSDPNSGLKIFRRDVAMALIPWLPDGFSCSTSLLMGFLVCGLSVHYEPIRYQARVGKSKFRPLKDTWNYLRIVLRFIKAFRPWRIYLPTGTLCLLAALVLTATLFTSHWEFKLAVVMLLVVAGAVALLSGVEQHRRAQVNLAQIRQNLQSTGAGYDHGG